MSERDPLPSLLRAWKAPEPPADLDRRILDAYRAARPAPAWWRLWSARVSVPVPVLVALTLVFVWVIWFRAKPANPPNAAEVFTRLGATGYQALPNGEARIVPIKESLP